MSLKQRLINVGIATYPKLVIFGIGFAIATAGALELGSMTGDHLAYAKIEPQESFQN